MAEKSLVPIGSVGADGTLYANPAALSLGGGNTGIAGGIFASQMAPGAQMGQPVMVGQQPQYVMMGGGGGGLPNIPWQAIKGGFFTVAGLFQRANQESLKDDLTDAEAEYTTAKSNVDAALNVFSATGTPANQLAWMRAQSVLNEATRKVNDAQTALGIENARSSLYTTAGGVGDLMQSFGGGTYPGLSGFGGGVPMMAAQQPMMVAAPQPVMMAAQQQPMVYIQNQGWTPIVGGFIGGIGGGLLANAFTSDRK